MTTTYVGRHRRPPSDTRILVRAVLTGATIITFPLLAAFAIILGALDQAGAL